jgi:ectoine hydroxylase-related dioxygenase (phytanoyl-CoA dioxygenase family)
MKLTENELSFFEKEGYLLLPNLFSESEIERLNKETIPLMLRDSPDVIWEEDNKSVRALMGCHFKSEFFKLLVRQSRLLSPTMQVLESEAYVYQFKINLKSAFKGEIWPWHQDYIYWHELDGMPTSRSLNVTVFLDDCTEFNGPLWFIPGSHSEGILRPSANRRKDGDWSQDVAADLSFKVDEATVSRLVDRGGIVSPKGKAGSVLIFHPNILHASLPNISPFERKILIVTYNSVKNIPIPKEKARPSFLVNPDTRSEVVSELTLLTDQVVI